MHLLRCVGLRYQEDIHTLLTILSGSGHQSPGLWRHPKDQSANFNDIDHWVDLAKVLESAKIHGIFIADVLVG